MLFNFLRKTCTLQPIFIFSKEAFEKEHDLIGLVWCAVLRFLPIQPSLQIQFSLLKHLQLPHISKNLKQGIKYITLFKYLPMAVWLQPRRKIKKRRHFQKTRWQPNFTTLLIIRYKMSHRVRLE